ncbi:hypothetical protein KFK09_026665 [Dendrobium nobile]|uniref:Uncharacterized protein n=1 Tax=Dendrobium nobile TaxID=94219 RepID=A0A8T3A8R4_DENNO|nr:hypothetical protein KFK09_026665 [Dendrobium nobile]
MNGWSSGESPWYSGLLELDRLSEAVEDSVDVYFNRFVVFSIWLVERREENVDLSLGVVSKIMINFRIVHA